MVAPMPAPSTAMYSEAAKVLVVGARWDRRYRPTVMVAVPTTGKILYRPHLLISWPAPIEVASSPAISGSSRRPETVGLTPLTTCRYCGKYVSAPNIAKPTTKPIAEAAANIGCLNRGGGRTGPAGRRLATPKPTANNPAGPRQGKGGADPAE